MQPFRRYPCVFLLAVAASWGIWGAEKPASAKATPLKPVVRPRHDPVDQPFRWAPMAQASRSLVIPLGNRMHLAFDADRLRTHTVWAGDPLNLFGTPYHGGKTPFLCTISGEALWTMPPFSSWSWSEPLEKLPELAPGSDFRGVEVKEGRVTVFYDVVSPSGKAVRVRETPYAVSLGALRGVVRRFELESLDQDMWFLAQAEFGKFQSNPSVKDVLGISREGNALISWARGLANMTWKRVEGRVSYEEKLHAEAAGGESDIEDRQVNGDLARAWLRIPAQPGKICFEVVSVVCPEGELTEAVLERMKTELSANPDEGSPVPRRDVAELSEKRFAGDPAARRPPGGDQFYRVEHFPLPRAIQLQVTGMGWMPNGELAVCTWLGEIYMVEGATGLVEAARYRRFARGLNEPLGLQVVDGAIYVVQKHELTRIRDRDGDGEADLFETINNDWGYSGNYHAFAFGPVIDAQGNFYAFLCGQRGRWDVPYVGWAVRISPEGRKMAGFCSGLRAPNGFGTYGPDNDLFIAENQGNWVGACKLNHLREGRFYGFPSGYPAPEAEYGKAKSFEQPALWFPRKLAPSASGFVTIPQEGFGPFGGQVLVGDFQNAVVVRAFLEKVNGEWQGAVWPFTKGFLSGVNRLSFGPDGKLYVGGVENAAWPSFGPRDYSLDRVSFTGKAPFAIREARVRPDGFELHFTAKVEPESAGNPDNYDVAQFTYLYHATYGSPEVDHEGNKESASSIKIAGVHVGEDRNSVRLTLEGMKRGFVTQVQAFDLKSAEGDPLWHDTFYYTLNEMPGM